MLMFISQQRIQQLMNMTIVILKSHDLESINTFKKFLTFIPNPNQIREIIRAAVEELFDTNTETIFWLLQNPESLQPELNIKEIATQKLSQKLHLLGLNKEDFYFNNDGKLKLNEAIKEELLSNSELLSLIQFFLAD